MIIRGGENIYPREIEAFLFGMQGIVDSFPLTASGKVQKYKLQEQSLEHFPEASVG